MKMKSIVFMGIISFAALSCNLQYLGPDNALEEASKINFFCISNTFACCQ